MRGEKQNTQKCSLLTSSLHKRQVMLDAAKFCSCFIYFFFLQFFGGGGWKYLSRAQSYKKLGISNITAVTATSTKEIKNITQICLVPSILFVSLLYLRWSANEASINFSPFSRILLGGLVKLHGTYNFFSRILQDSTPKVEL